MVKNLMLERSSTGNAIVPAVGMSLPELVKRPTRSMLFRFSAVTWNAHRIHYDQPYAQSENHPDILVQATMHGAFLLQMLNAFVGSNGRIASFQYANRGRAVPGDTLTCGGIITGINRTTGEIACDIWERNQDGQTCAKGQATLVLAGRQ